MLIKQVFKAEKNKPLMQTPELWSISLPKPTVSDDATTFAIGIVF